MDTGKWVSLLDDIKGHPQDEIRGRTKLIKMIVSEVMTDPNFLNFLTGIAMVVI